MGAKNEWPPYFELTWNLLNLVDSAEMHGSG